MPSPVFWSSHECCNTFKLQHFQWYSLLLPCFSYAHLLLVRAVHNVEMTRERPSEMVSLEAQMVMNSSELLQGRFLQRKVFQVMLVVPETAAEGRQAFSCRVPGKKLAQLYQGSPTTSFNTHFLQHHHPVLAKRLLPGACRKSQQCKEKPHKTASAPMRQIPNRWNLNSSSQELPLDPPHSTLCIWREHQAHILTLSYRTNLKIMMVCKTQQHICILVKNTE